MSTEQDNTPSSGEKPSKPGKESLPLRTFPPLRNFLIAGTIFAIGLVVWLVGAFRDHAIENIVLMLCTFIAVMFPVTWYTFFSRWTSNWRYIPLLTLVVVLFGPFAFGRFREVNGEMVPSRWTWWWEKTPDQRLAALPSPAVGYDAPADAKNNTTPHDFPQFLGPSRNQYLSGPILERDWKEHPPKLVWQEKIGAGWSAFSVVNGLAVTMEQRDDEELVTCYELLSGQLKWAHGIQARYDTWLGGVGPRATPTIDQGRVYAMGATGVLRCLDFATGQPIWQKNVSEEFGLSPGQEASLITYGRSNSPLIVDGLVVIPAGGPTTEKAASLVAYDRLTGEEVWRGGHDQIGYSSPVLATLDGVRQILSVNESTVSGHDPASGKTLWSHEWAGNSSTESNNSQPVAVGDNRVLVTKGYRNGGALLEVERDSAGKWSVEEVWHERAVLKTKFTNVVLHDGYVYALSDGILECVNVQTGEQMWKRGRYNHGQILGVGDVLLILHETRGDVVMVALNPEKHEQLGKFPALDTSKVWNNLALYGPYLLVRDAETAACWKLPVVGETASIPNIEH